MKAYAIQLEYVDTNGATDESPDPVREIIHVQAETPWDAYQKATKRMTIKANGGYLKGFDGETGLEIEPTISGQFYRRGRFAIPSVQGPYIGYTADDEWNGWAVPCFEQDVAERIAADFVRVAEEMGTGYEGARAHYDQTADAFVLYDPINDEEAVYERRIISVDGIELKVYPIGTYQWTWEEVTA